VGLMEDAPTVAELVSRLTAEYDSARARLLDQRAA
jgi:nitronate monooxygenase